MNVIGSAATFKNGNFVVFANTGQIMPQFRLEVVGNDRTSFTCAEHAVDEDIRVGMGHGFALSVSREPGMTSVRDVTDGSERRAVPTGLGSPVAAITQDFRPGLYHSVPAGLISF